MAKTKINLVNGTVIEKPLITCFKGTYGNYIVLDNETNGTMGFPVICISKYNNNVAEKIVDPGEWAAVKECLKTIIGGTMLPYLSVEETINTKSEDFYTQLTLPVASFDLLKSVYAPVQPVSAPAPAAEMQPSPTQAPAPVQATIPEPTVMPSAISYGTLPTAEPVTPPTSVSVETPQATNDSVVPGGIPLTPAAATDDITAIKENFMKSCETMFDALVNQFKK